MGRVIFRHKDIYLRLSNNRKRAFINIELFSYTIFQSSKTNYYIVEFVNLLNRSKSRIGRMLKNR